MASKPAGRSAVENGMLRCGMGEMWKWWRFAGLVVVFGVVSC